MSEYGSNPIRTLRKEMVNRESQVQEIIGQSDKLKIEEQGMPLPRTCDNHRSSCDCRYTPAHVRFNIKENFIIYFNTLKPYRQQFPLILVKKTNYRSRVIIGCKENLKNI